MSQENLREMLRLLCTASHRRAFGFHRRCSYRLLFLACLGGSSTSDDEDVPKN